MRVKDNGSKESKTKKTRQGEWRKETVKKRKAENEKEIMSREGIAHETGECVLRGAKSAEQEYEEERARQRSRVRVK